MPHHASTRKAPRNVAPEPRISGHDARVLLGVKRSQFQRLARQGHFGRHVSYSNDPRSQRYYLRSLVEEFLREREKAASLVDDVEISKVILSRIKSNPKQKETTP